MTGSMPSTPNPLRLTYIGGPTALLEYGGLRFLTDPTFDAAGTDYPHRSYTLHQTQAPALAAERLGKVDAILLSHDHHFDNLDHAGREAWPPRESSSRREMERSVLRETQRVCWPGTSARSLHRMVRPSS